MADKIKKEQVAKEMAEIRKKEKLHVK